ncbi:MAG: HAMP domain-containing histidine kinase [Sulfitobacter sp.]|nr:HAMP domain-containing histidine kinase [Sulfitobacter sp.]
MIGLLPQALAQRLPLLVLVAYVAGAVITGLSVYNFNKRGSALNEAETSGEVLAEIIRRETAKSLNAPGSYTRAPYTVERRRSLPEALPTATVPLILELDETRYRAAIRFDQPAKLPQALQTGDSTLSAADRLAALSKAIARQDQETRLVLFLPGGDVLFIDAPRLWQDRFSQTLTALLGVAGFAIGLSLFLPLAVNLAAPFQRLAIRRLATRPMPPLASTEALMIGDRIDHLTEQFRNEQERKSRGLAAISHDLRTPVTRMRLRTELLEDPALHERFEADLDEITGIIDGALDLLSIGAQEEESLRFSLVSLLESLVNDYRDVGRNVEFIAPEEVDLRSAGSIFAAAEDVRVRADNQCFMRGQPDKLRRAFSNLIDNALKYGGRAVVEVGPDTESTLKVSVRDFGPGIEPDQLDRVILPFMRGHGATKERGVGLGLSIASEIVALHGGRLEFTNMETGLLVTAQVARDAFGAG